MNNIKINVNYFVLNNTIENVKYFIRRGHLCALLYDRLKWFWFPRLNIVPQFPQTVDIETSLSCQLTCSMCMRAVMDPDKLNGLMDFSLFKKIIDECSRNNVFSIKLSWRGEPTLNPQLVDMVRYAKSQGIRDVAFLTNGGLITKQLAEDLTMAGLDWISFSIDGLGETYEKIRKPITFEKIVNTVQDFHSIKKRKKLTKPLIRIQTISSIVNDTPEYFRFWRQYADRIAVIAEQHREDPTMIKHNPNYICQSPFQRVFITWDGNIIPCHGDYFLHNSMGNIKDNSIQEIWHSEKFNHFRNKMRSKNRLDFEGCRLCPDGGEYRKDSLKVQGKTIPIIKYLENSNPKTRISDEDKHENCQNLG